MRWWELECNNGGEGGTVNRVVLREHLTGLEPHAAGVAERRGPATTAASPLTRGVRRRGAAEGVFFSDRRGIRKEVAGARWWV
jgi:hypothetical protein